MHDSNHRLKIDRRRFLAGVGSATTALVLAKNNALAAAESDLPADSAAQSVHTTDTPSPPSTAVIVLNKMGYGPRPGDVERFNSLGANDAERLTNYVEEQLAPEQIDDSECDARLSAAGFTALNKSQVELWTEHRRSSDWSTRFLPLWELEKAQFLRAVFSKRQLNEMLVEFWQNHFNIYAHETYAAAPFVGFDRDILRAHLFGNFRTMLGLTARSSVMLRYLDNYINSVDGPNENYARELFELHTLGAENYYGVLNQDDVPTDSNGVPVGYVDQDVYEATRCLTGWSYSYNTGWGDDDTGQFLYRADRHDRFQKFVLGQKFLPDQAAERDGEDLLDLVAYHPGTGKHIARKLCRRFISDNPPQSLVDSAAAIFYDNRYEDDQLTKVYRHILTSAELRTTWGEKVKRPLEVTVSFLRATDCQITFRQNHTPTSRFISYYNNIGQKLYSWGPPDGYPDTMEAWNTTGNRVFLWRMLNELIATKADAADTEIVTDDISGDYYIDILGQTPVTVRSATALVLYWVERLLYRSLEDSEDRTEMINFMANGLNNGLDLPLDTDRDTQDRLRMLITLICGSPDFFWK